MKNIPSVLYRFYEMVLWLIILIINIIWWFFIVIPYLFTGKDYISVIGRIHQKCLFKKSDDPFKPKRNMKDRYIG